MVMPTKPAPGDQTLSNGCLVAIVIAILIAMISMCSKNPATSGGDGNATMTEQAGNSMAASIRSAVAAQPKTAVRPFSAADSGVGISRERIAETAEGLTGAMIYSQNCYDALTRSFRWSKLDQCGGFDAATVARMEKIGGSERTKEIDYFDSETAAGRFLSAATAAGEDAEAADIRWSKVQRMASRGAGRTVAIIRKTSSGPGTRTPAEDPWKANHVLTAAEEAAAEAANAQQ